MIVCLNLVKKNNMSKEYWEKKIWWPFLGKSLTLAFKVNVKELRKPKRLLILLFDIVQTSSDRTIISFFCLTDDVAIKEKF